MRAVVQRVSAARVNVEGQVAGEIARGLLILLGIAGLDSQTDIDYIVGKVRDLRVFDDDQGRMNRSIVEAGGSLLVVSQFTLYGDCRKGRRPSFDRAAPPALARTLYEEVVKRLREIGVPVQTGSFQARMDVELVNDGPVTLLLDSSRQF
jgi:D-aminoacyl-tRNA deacylase